MMSNIFFWAGIIIFLLGAVIRYASTKKRDGKVSKSVKYLSILCCAIGLVFDLISLFV